MRSLFYKCLLGFLLLAIGVAAGCDLGTYDQRSTEREQQLRDEAQAIQDQ